MSIKKMTIRLEKNLAYKLELERQISQRKNDLVQLNKQYQDNLEQKHTFERLYNEVRSSTSWIVTKPLRKAAKPFFKLRGVESTHRVESLKQKLLGLGLSEQASKDLEHIAKRKRNSLLRRLAAWELANWYANKYEIKSAHKCLEFLAIAKDRERDPEKLKRIAVLEAESLELVKKSGQAKLVLLEAMKTLGKSADLYLGLANIETNQTDKIENINKALELSGTNPIEFASDTTKSLYDRISSPFKSLSTNTSTPKISILIPAYNAGDTIHTSIDAMLSQSWENLEVIVADDYSTDNTVEVVGSYMKKDPRVKLVKNQKNSGPYVARNLALNEATGDFVTCHDSDDWSHPDKLKYQAEHLIKNPGIIANTTQQARASNNMIFHRRGNQGFYIQFNMSSLMFRREPVMRQIGYWDSVRFGADSEFIKRLKKVFGSSSVANLTNSLLSFQRKSDESLTGSSKFGFHGFFMGARKEYVELQESYYSNAKSLKYSFPQSKRPFPVPEPMLPIREVKKSQPRIFEVIYIGDFRDAKLSRIALDEITKLSSVSKIALVQLPDYTSNTRTKIRQSIREVCVEKNIPLLVYGELAEAKTVIVRNAELFEYKYDYFPEINCNNLAVVTRNPHLESKSVLHTRMEQIKGNLSSIFGTTGTWYLSEGYPNRTRLSDHIHLSSETWQVYFSKLVDKN